MLKEYLKFRKKNYIMIFLGVIFAFSLVTFLFEQPNYVMGLLVFFLVFLFSEFVTVREWKEKKK